MVHRGDVILESPSPLLQHKCLFQNSNTWQINLATFHTYNILTDESHPWPAARPLEVAPDAILPVDTAGDLLWSDTAATLAGASPPRVTREINIPCPYGLTLKRKSEKLECVWLGVREGRGREGGWVGDARSLAVWGGNWGVRGKKKTVKPC